MKTLGVIVDDGNGNSHNGGAVGTPEVATAFDEGARLDIFETNLQNIPGMEVTYVTVRPLNAPVILNLARGIKTYRFDKLNPESLSRKVAEHLGELYPVHDFQRGVHSYMFDDSERSLIDWAVEEMTR